MSLDLELTGRIVHITEVQQITATFSKRNLLLEIPDDKYPQVLSLEITNADLMETVSHLGVGEEIKAWANLRGRRNPKNPEMAFNSLVCWRVQTTQGGAIYTKPESGGEVDKTNSDLPF